MGPFFVYICLIKSCIYLSALSRAGLPLMPQMHFYFLLPRKEPTPLSEGPK